MWGIKWEGIARYFDTLMPQKLYIVSFPHSTLRNFSFPSYILSYLQQAGINPHRPRLSASGNEDVVSQAFAMRFRSYKPFDFLKYF